MKTTFDMRTDDTYPVHGTLEVRGTRVRLEIGRTFGAFTDADDIERLANLLTTAASAMRRNGSCPDCGGKGYTLMGADHVDCYRCLDQGVVPRAQE